MTTRTFYAIFALCLIAQPLPGTNVKNAIISNLTDIDILLSSEDDSSNQTSTNQSLKSDQQNTQSDEENFELQQGIAKYLPQFFQSNKLMLEKLQRGNHEGVLVVGQTGAGKSALIGGLLGHKFVLQQQKVIESFEGGTMSYDQKKLFTQSPEAPKISRSKMESEIIFPAVYYSKETNLVFIDTAGLSATGKDDEVINICNALALRTIIEKIGSVKCIIGVITYNTFNEGRVLNAFLQIIGITHSLLTNQSPETCTSSMVLAFTKVPGNITKHHILKLLKKRCLELMKRRKNNESKVDMVYKLLFPSFCGLKNRQDVPFFLISKSVLLKQGLISNNMLPTIQNAQKVDKRDVGLALDRSLLQKIKVWLTNKVQSIAKDIRAKEKVEDNIAYIQGCLSFKQKQLLNKGKFLTQLTDFNNKDIKKKKENCVKHLNNTIQNNTRRITKLGVKIKEAKKQSGSKVKELNTLNTNTIKLYKKISGCYHRETNTYKYFYNDVPIHHIIYVPRKTKPAKYNHKLFTLFNPPYKKDPKTNHRLSHDYKVLSMEKNYKKGILNITLKNNLTYGETFARVFILGSDLSLAHYDPPCDFQIYAKKKDIYHNTINILWEAIQDLEENQRILKDEKQALEEKTKCIEDQSKQLALDLSSQQCFIKKTKNEIKTKSTEVKKIQLVLYNFHNQLNLLKRKLSNNQITPYIITHLASFIEVHNNQQHNIEACKRYINTKHTDNQPGLQLKSNIEDQQAEHKEDNSYKENIASSSNLISSIGLGTILMVANMKKRLATQKN